MGPLRRFAALPFLLSTALPCHAVIVTGPTGRRSDPPDTRLFGTERGGWNYVGEWGIFTGVSVGPHHFLTARHVGGRVGNLFRYQGSDYATIEQTPVEGADLVLWKVDRRLPSWAPLARRPLGEGTRVVVVGRGRAPGQQVLRDGIPVGWTWGKDDHALSWGEAPLSGTHSSRKGEPLWEFAFDDNGCGLAAGDSGGGVFVRENRRWALVGICHATQGLWKPTREGVRPFGACLWDIRGYAIDKSGSPVQDPGKAVPSRWFASRVDLHAGTVARVAAPEPWLDNRKKATAAGLMALALGTFLVQQSRRRAKRRVLR